MKELLDILEQIIESNNKLFEVILNRNDAIIKLLEVKNENN